MEKMWKTVDDLLALFSIDPSTEGAQDFTTLCDLTSLMHRFPEYGMNFYDVCGKRLRELRWSPKVFYSRVRRAIKPMVEADMETLAGLGLQIEGDKITVPALVKAIAPILAADIPASCADTAAQTAAYLAEGKKAAPPQKDER